MLLPNLGRSPSQVHCECVGKLNIVDYSLSTPLQTIKSNANKNGMLTTMLCNVKESSALPCKSNQIDYMVWDGNIYLGMKDIPCHVMSHTQNKRSSNRRAIPWLLLAIAWTQVCQPITVECILSKTQIVIWIHWWLVEVFPLCLKSKSNGLCFFTMISLPSVTYTFHTTKKLIESWSRIFFM